MIPVNRFLQGIRDIRAAQPTYRQGGSGVDGTCDCIGLIIGAIRRAGGTWTGTHGSNYAARNEMLGLRRVISAAELEVGEAIYKARAPGDAGYALPTKYSTSGDLLDYYHVGVVMSVTPLEIWHCTTSSGSGGIKVDTKLGIWAWVGWLRKVSNNTQEGDDGMATQKAVVVATSGSTVYLRKLPDRKSNYLARVPLGTVVDVLEVGSEWCTVMALGQRGYMMREFLELEGDGNSGDGETEQEEPSETLTSILARLDALEAWRAAVEAGGHSTAGVGESITYKGE